MEAPLSQLAAMLDERFDYAARRDKTKDRRITPVRDDLLGPMQPALLATLAATALILLIACANVAALVLGQVDARSGEFAVRSALGANRQRLAQQLIVEVLIVAVVAGTLGAALAWVGFTVVTDTLPLGAWAGAAPDWRVFVAAMAIALIAASLVILVPIVSLYRGDLRSVLSAARMGGIEGRGGRLESGLVVAQVALAVMIASGAALLARSVANMYAVQPGVRVDGVAVVDVVFDGTLDRASREKTLDELERALRELPGVTSVGAGQKLAATRRRVQGGPAHRRTPGDRERSHRIPNRDARLSREPRLRPSPGPRDQWRRPGRSRTCRRHQRGICPEVLPGSRSHRQVDRRRR